MALSTETSIRRGGVLNTDKRLSETINETIWESGLFIFFSAIVVIVFMLDSLMATFPLFELSLLVPLYIYKRYQWRPHDDFIPSPQNVRAALDKNSSPLYSTGFEVARKEPVWFTNDQMRQHMLIMGTTGAGKTEFLLYLVAQALAQGSGAIFVDGKGDLKTWFRLFSIAKRLGLEENLRLLNFGTNQKDGELKYDLSNTLNIFTLGDAGQLAEMMSSLMAEAGGDNAMWKGRAEGLMRALLKALVDLRDTGVVILGSGVLSDNMALDKVAAFENDARISLDARTEIKRYLDSVPGFRAGGPQGKAESDKQHGFLTMQFTDVLSLLNNSYAHIMQFQLGEVNFSDVLFSRRMLFVLLPSMEKSPSSCKNLGKIVVNQIRVALSKTLGSAPKGSKAEKLLARPTTSTTPTLLILDEYGSYAVEGFGEVAAQARSIGVSTIFAVQDWASLQKADKEGNEAQRIWANTNIKIIMKTEDSEKTMKVVMERIKKAYMLENSGKELNEDSMMGGQRNQKTSRYLEVDRIDSLDLFKIKNGLHYVITEDRVFKVQSTYLKDDEGAWATAHEAYMMRQVPVLKPSFEEVADLFTQTKKTLTSQQESMEQMQQLLRSPDDALEASLVKNWKASLEEAKGKFKTDPSRESLMLLRDFIVGSIRQSISEQSEVIEAAESQSRRAARPTASRAAQDAASSPVSRVAAAQSPLEFSEEMELLRKAAMEDESPLGVDFNDVPDLESLSLDGDDYGGSDFSGFNDDILFSEPEKVYPASIAEAMPPMNKQEVVTGARDIALQQESATPAKPSQRSRTSRYARREEETS